MAPWRNGRGALDGSPGRFGGRPWLAHGDARCRGARWQGGRGARHLGEAAVGADGEGADRAGLGLIHVQVPAVRADPGVDGTDKVPTAPALVSFTYRY